MNARSVLALALAAASSGPARAQESAAAPSEEIALFELDQALAKETTIASRRARTARETPGIVTILTRDEILASGARDLADLLLRVPGFQLGVDVESAIGVGFRGIWGHEGKVLFLLDGIEMNDLSYGTFPLGHHLLAEQIEKVEVIRGPGSALYGGQAELAVVSVTTRAATPGVSVAAAAGTMTDAISLVDGALAAGFERGGASAGVSVAVGTGYRSDRTFTDLYGGSTDMADSSRVTPITATAAASWKGLSLRALSDDYRTTMQDGYDTVSGTNVHVRWRTAAADAEWKIPVGERLSIVPRVTYRRELPWQVADATLATYYYDVTNERLTGRVVATLDPTPAASVLAGVEAYWERGRVNDPSNGILAYGTSDRVTYENVAAFAEAGVDTSLANALLGVRYEHHSEFGNSFVPRLALTKLFAPFHVKLLASGAFRAPSIEDVNYGVDLKPERTWAFEAELGWQATEALYVAANAFDITVDRPIVFGYDPVTAMDAYRNDRSTGSRGVELEVRGRLPFGSAQLGWSWYDAAGKNHVTAYEVPGRRDLLLGFAGHKVVGSVQARIGGHLVVTPSAIFLSERYAYDHLDGLGNPAVGRVPARLYLDLFAAWRDLGVRGLELGAGVRNALDQHFDYLQPYDGAHAPLPGASREVFVRLRYDLAG